MPRFVLGELQHIADDAQPGRRSRGRRGLDVLSVLQKDHRVELELTDEDAPEVKTVDAKLVALARARGAAILTTDYNLNRVAQLQGVRVMNLNQLANAMKPAFLPGEELRVKVIQEGKEPGQGVAFLDDGTMIVVEGGGSLPPARARRAPSRACSRRSPAGWSSPSLREPARPRSPRRARSTRPLRGTAPCRKRRRSRRHSRPGGGENAPTNNALP